MPNPRRAQLSEQTLKQNPGRYAGRELGLSPESPLGPAPRHLNGDQRKVWAEVVQRVPAGVLFDCDRFIVELTVQLTLKMRKGSLTATDTAQYRGCLASLGITPADRSRVKTPPKPPQKSLLERILDGDDEIA